MCLRPSIRPHPVATRDGGPLGPGMIIEAAMRGQDKAAREFLRIYREARRALDRDRGDLDVAEAMRMAVDEASAGSGFQPDA